MYVSSLPIKIFHQYRLKTYYESDLFCYNFKKFLRKIKLGIRRLQKNQNSQNNKEKFRKGEE